MRKADDPGPKPPLDGVHDGEYEFDSVAAAADAPDPELAPSECACAALRAVSDAQLAAWIQSVVDHDERALAALYDATLSRVYGLVQRIVRNRASADEVVEDTYFQAPRVRIPVASIEPGCS